MFADTEQQAKVSRDPVAPATRSAAAQTKVATHALVDGTPAHSFATLITELATLVRNTCRAPNVGAHAPTFEVTNSAEPMHQGAFALVQTIKLYSENRNRNSSQVLESQRKFVCGAAQLQIGSMGRSVNRG